jgi:hypothetical protein
MDDDSFDLAMLGVDACCSGCGQEVPEGDLHTLPAAARWAEDEADDHDRDVQVCAACAHREKPAAGEAPRARLASGTRRVPLPLRKAG